MFLLGFYFCVTAVYFIILINLALDPAIDKKIVILALIGFLFFVYLTITGYLRTKKKEKEEHGLINAHIHNVTAILKKTGIKKITDDGIRYLEQTARKNIDVPLNKYHLSICDFRNTKSSLGYCTYRHGYLLTSLEMSFSNPNTDVCKIDLIAYFQNFPSFHGSEFLQSFLKYIDNPSPKTMVNLPELIRFEHYVSIIADSSVYGFRISKMRAIKLKNIEYYKVEGTSQYVSYVKGGGANLAGAIYGGILGGGAGAVVGSKVNTDIKTDIVKKDDRKLFLYYYVNGVLTNEEIVCEDIDFVLSMLREWIPEKEYSHIISKNTNNFIENEILPQTNLPKVEKQASVVNHSYAELKELKELLDLGIITKEEFERKKCEIWD